VLIINRNFRKAKTSLCRKTINSYNVKGSCRTHAAPSGRTPATSGDCSNRRGLKNSKKSETAGPSTTGKASKRRDASYSNSRKIRKILKITVSDYIMPPTR
jgi:hypothetical protein